MKKRKWIKKIINITTSINIITKLFLFYFLLVLFVFFLPFVICLFWSLFVAIRIFENLKNSIWRSNLQNIRIFWLRVDYNFFPRLITDSRLISRKNPGVYMETSGVITQTMWLRKVLVKQKYDKKKNSDYVIRYISKKTRITSNLQPVHGLCCGIHEKM